MYRMEGVQSSCVRFVYRAKGVHPVSEPSICVVTQACRAELHPCNSCPEIQTYCNVESAGIDFVLLTQVNLSFPR